MKTHVLFLFFLMTAITLAFGQASEDSRPNIVFCLADDWGWPHAGAYGAPGIKTPSFDRLAKEGVLFHQAYVSSPSCTPSRNAFITGKYHWELGSGANLWSTLPVEHQSFIHLLADEGYVTGRTEAKTWGPGNLDEWTAEHGAHPGNAAYQTFGEFLDKTAAKENPFFFWLGSADPHRPYEEGIGQKSGIDVSKVHMFKHYPDVTTVRSDVADYYWEVQRWDQLVGSVIDELEAQDLLDNTIIIVTGDHGMPFPRGKGNLYDSGVRVPFVVYWGSHIQSGRHVEDFVSFADIAPTVLEAAGVKVPEEMTGKSFLNVLNAEKSGLVDPENRSEVVFGRERHVPAQEKPNMGGYPSRGYRNDEFLYIRNYQPSLWPAGTGQLGATNYPNQWYADCDGGPTKDYIVDHKEKDLEHIFAYQLCFAKRPAEELYDLRNDPDQLVNVAAQADYAETLESMREKLHQNLFKA